MDKKKVIVVIDSLLDFGEHEWKRGSLLYGNCFEIETSTTKYYLIKDIPTLVCYFSDQHHFVRIKSDVSYHNDMGLGHKIIIGRNLPNRLEGVPKGRCDYYEPKSREEYEIITYHDGCRTLFGLDGWVYNNTSKVEEQFNKKLIPLLSMIKKWHTSPIGEERDFFALDKTFIVGLNLDQINILRNKGFALSNHQFCNEIVEQIPEEDLAYSHELKKALTRVTS